jgi:hypothetical protein
MEKTAEFVSNKKNMLDLYNLYSGSILSRSAFITAVYHLLMSNYVTNENKLNEALAAVLSDGDRPYRIFGPKTHHETIEDIRAASSAMWTRASIQMQRICDANNIVYLHFLQPSQYYEDSKPLNEEEYRQAYEASGLRSESAALGYPLLIEAGKKLRSEEVAFYDLTLLFKRESRTIYSDTCCHFTDLGKTLLAKHIATVVMGALEQKNGAKNVE